MSKKENKKQSASLLLLGAVIVLATVVFAIFLYNPAKKVPVVAHTTSDAGLPVLGPKSSPKRPGADTIYKTLNDFSFYDQRGEVVTKEDLEGKIVIADAFFSSCQGICIDLSRNMRALQKHFVNDPEIKLLSITVDPVADSVPTLQNYANRQKAIDGKWYFLTGDSTEIYNFLQRDFFFKAMPNDDPDGMAFLHDGAFRLIDQRGRFRGSWSYDGTNDTTVQVLIEAIETLKKEYAESK